MMPMAPLRPCVEPGCSELVPRGRCAVHALQKEHTRFNYAVRRLYRTERWRTLRLQVLAEEPVCQVCLLSGSVTAATVVDHIERHHGDPVMFWSRSNLQSLCDGCHGVKTAKGE